MKRSNIVMWRGVLGSLAIAAMMVVSAATPVAARPPQDYEVLFGVWWAYWDRPVEQGIADRSWTWGQWIEEAPGAEPYVEGLLRGSTYEGELWEREGERAVRYYDKARMEYWPDREGWSPVDNLWKVTTGLLATELMTGNLQLGDEVFEQHEPSEMPVAGDPDSGDLTPSYADMGPVMAYQPIPAGWTIIQTIDENGSVGADQRFAEYGVTAVEVGAPTNHTVASVFWAWMTQVGVTYQGRLDDPYVTEQLFPNPFYATGYPTTEAYWTRARVGGVERDVLLQCFERRCLTYTPDNPEGWQVEMANVGRHYYHWRYVEIPAANQD